MTDESAWWWELDKCFISTSDSQNKKRNVHQLMLSGLRASLPVRFPKYTWQSFPLAKPVVLPSFGWSTSWLGMKLLRGGSQTMKESSHHWLHHVPWWWTDHCTEGKIHPEVGQPQTSRQTWLESIESFTRCASYCLMSQSFEIWIWDWIFSLPGA